MNRFSKIAVVMKSVLSNVRGDVAPKLLYGAMGIGIAAYGGTEVAGQTAAAAKTGAGSVTKVGDGTARVVGAQGGTHTAGGPIFSGAGGGGGGGGGGTTN
jgi:hypothetical protein